MLIQQAEFLHQNWKETKDTASKKKIRGFVCLVRWFKLKSDSGRGHGARGDGSRAAVLLLGRTAAAAGTAGECRGRRLSAGVRAATAAGHTVDEYVTSCFWSFRWKCPDSNETLKKRANFNRNSNLQSTPSGKNKSRTLVPIKFAFEVSSYIPRVKQG